MTKDIEEQSTLVRCINVSEGGFLICSQYNFAIGLKLKLFVEAAMGEETKLLQTLITTVHNTMRPNFSDFVIGTKILKDFNDTKEFIKRYVEYKNKHS